MNEPSATPTVRFIRFGLFEADLQTGELRKNGLKIKLQEQPFRVLTLLLERAGEVVPREELRQQLWSTDTFVDFEHSLNSSVKKLRQALEDSADNPRFVETLARRGYRFIAPVEQVRERLSNSNLAVDLVTDTSLPLASPSELQEVNEIRRRRWTAGWAWVAVLIALILTGVGWFYFRRAATPPMKVVRFTSYPGKEKDPALSPDGQRLAFAWDGESGDNFDIYARSIGPAGELPLTTERALRLTTDPAPDLSPTWSPDGRYLAFARVKEGNSGVYVVPSIGGEERKLVGFYWIWEGNSLDWSPSGKSLVVTAKNSREGPYSLYSISVDTGNNRKLTSPTEGMRADLFPAFSPDGQTLAFRRFIPGNYLYLLPLDQSEPKRVPTHADNWGHAWGADGLEIVFASPKGGTAQLWSVSTPGAKPRPLGIGGNASDPTISGQGNRLAYVEVGYDTDIWRIEMPNSGSQGVRRTKVISSSQRDENPQYSPDGNSIAFMSNRSGSWEIWLCDSEGRNARQLTSFPEASVTGSHRWSPDGRQIAFSSVKNHHGHIFVVDREPGSPRWLTEKAPDAGLPCWSQDGRWIYFWLNRSGDNQIWRMPVEGGEAVPVTKNGGFECLVAPDGRTLYYTKLNWGGPAAGSAQLWKVSVEGGEETLVFDRAIYPRYWTLAEQGIYFVPSDWSARPTIEFFSFSTGQITQVVALEKPPVRGFHPGLSISSDGRSILCALVEQDTSDIMLVENFR